MNGTEDRERLNVESSDILWIVNKCKKSERYIPMHCRTSDLSAEILLKAVENSPLTLFFPLTNRLPKEPECMI